MCAIKDPAALPWKELGVDIVVESTGLFSDTANASKHLQAGAKKVIITAPAKDPDVTLVLGVNEKTYDPAKHRIVSNASCTTNCLATTAKVLRRQRSASSAASRRRCTPTPTTSPIHDFPHKDLRRARAGAVSMIPTTTGAATAVGLVLPKLKGKLDGIAIRVPTVNVSVVDLTVELEKPATVEAVNDAFREAAAGPLKGILDATDEELVSVDFNGNPHSLDRGPAVHRARGRQPGQGAGLVRQRVGLLFTRARPDPVHRQVAVADRHACKLSIEQVDLAGRRVFLRADFNAPLDGGRRHRRHAADRRRCPPSATRSSAGASVVLASHLGRPKGKPDPKYSLAPVADAAGRAAGPAGAARARLRGRRGGEPGARAGARRAPPAGEPALPSRGGGQRRRLRARAGRARRRATSTTPSPPPTARTPPSRPSPATCKPAAAGLLMAASWRRSDGSSRPPQRRWSPCSAAPRFGQDRAGGAPARAGRRAARSAAAWRSRSCARSGTTSAGRSSSPIASRWRASALETARRRGVQIVLPVDAVVAARARQPRRAARCRIREIPADQMGLDIGPATRRAVRDRAARGADDRVERPHGRVREARRSPPGTVGRGARGGGGSAFSVIGGGDTIAAVNQAGVADRIGYISTAGGAFLEFLEGRALPGVEALTEA